MSCLPEVKVSSLWKVQTADVGVLVDSLNSKVLLSAAEDDPSLGLLWGQLYKNRSSQKIDSQRLQGSRIRLVCGLVNFVPALA